MKSIVLGLTVVAMLAAPVLAGNVAVPLPGPGTVDIKAFSAAAEIFLENSTGDDIDLGGGVVIPDGFSNSVAIGAYQYNGNLNYVLYTGSSSTATPPGGAPVGPGAAVLAVNSTTTDPDVAAYGVPQVDIGALLSGTAVQGLRGRLYVSGVLNTISNQATGDLVTYNNGGSADTNPNPQLTFDLYNAYISDLNFNNSLPSSDIRTEFVLSPDDGEELHLDIWADATPDAQVAGIPTGGMRYERVGGALGSSHELPVRDLDGTLLVDPDTGTYYDVNGTGWERVAFAGDPNDDDNVFWSFVGNPDSDFMVTESFDDTESFVFSAANGEDLTIFVGGSSSVGMEMIGQFTPGVSLVGPGYTNTAGFVTLPSGEGYGNALLDPNGVYFLTGNFAYGGANTGAYDSDPNTYTFQQGPEGSIGTLTQLTGNLVIIPEPMTMFALLMGSGGLVGYLRRRRNA